MNKIEKLIENTFEIKEKLRERLGILAELISEDDGNVNLYAWDIRNSVSELENLDNQEHDLQQLKQERI